MSRGNIKEAGQVGFFGPITGLDSADFTNDGKVFNIKNNTGAEITLTVTPAGGGADVDMVFYPGWNVEIVSKITTDAAITDTDLSWGY